MKIVNLEELLKEPPGTIFMKYSNRDEVKVEGIYRFEAAIPGSKNFLYRDLFALDETTSSRATYCEFDRRMNTWPGMIYRDKFAIPDVKEIGEIMRFIA